MILLAMSMLLSLTLPEFELSIPGGYEYAGRYGAGVNITEVYRNDDLGLALIITDIRRVDEEFQLEREACFEAFCRGIIHNDGKLLSSGQLDLDGTRWDWRTMYKSQENGKLMGSAFFYFRGKAEGSVVVIFLGLESDEDDLREYGAELLKTMVSPPAK